MDPPVTGPPSNTPTITAAPIAAPGIVAETRRSVATAMITNIKMKLITASVPTFRTVAAGSVGMWAPAPDWNKK